MIKRTGFQFFRRMLVMGFSLGFVLILGASCSRPNPVLSHRIEIQIPSDPVSLDPAYAEDGVSVRILSNVMEGLYAYDQKGELVPALAESSQLDSDQKTYRFHLRSQLLWSDGERVLAQHFVDGIQRSLKMSIAGSTQAAMPSKLGVFLTGIETVKATSNQDLEIRLKNPDPIFLHKLTLPPALPVRLELLATNHGIWAQTFPATGAYKIAVHKRDQYLMLEPNFQYWRLDQNARVDSLRWVFLRVIQDESTALSLFEKGNLDVLTRVPSYDFARLKKLGRIHLDPALMTYYLAFNTRKTPFDRAESRRAVAAAIHKSELMETLGTGEEPASSLIPKPLEGYYSYVKQLEKPARFGPEKWMIGFDSGARNQLILEKIQQDLKKKFAVSIELQQRDWKAHIQSLNTDAPMIYRFGWLAPYRDALTFLQPFTSKDPNNYTGFKNSQYDAWIEQANVMPPGQKRTELIAKAQKLLIDQEAVVIPLYHYQHIHAVSARLKNFRVNPFGTIFYRNLGL